MNDFRDFLVGLLPKSQHGKIDAIMDRLDDDLSGWVVRVDNARPAIETVYVYGLIIGVDANGCAETIESTYDDLLRIEF